MIIALSGKMRVGKTTLANLLDPMLPVWHAPHNFGDEVKAECAKLLGVPRSTFYDQEMKDLDVQIPANALRHFGLDGNGPVWTTIRKAMQLRGETARKEQPGYWVYRLHERTHGLANVLIDDVRYPDEAEYVLGKPDHLLVRVHPHQHWTAGPHADHESETALDNWTDWDVELWPEFGQLEPQARKLSEIIAKRITK